MCVGVIGKEFLYQKVGIELDDEIQPEEPIEEYFYLEFDL